MEKEIKLCIHMGDIHIRTFKMHEEYAEVFKKTLKEIRLLVDGYDREEVRIVIAGDYVHQKITISNELLVLGTWFLKKLEKIAPVVLIAGNHDLIESNKDRLDSLTPMVNLLSDIDIRYYKKSECILDGNIVWCVYSIFEENARPDIESARAEYGNNKKYIGLFHGPLVGSTTDIGYEIDHGYGLEIFDGCDAVMCADIHKRQQLTYKGVPIVMPSSLIQQNFGETVRNHGFLTWDMETLTYTEHNIETDYGFYQFTMSSIDDIDNGTEKLTNY
jgi:DNA repair exonuclease SbcCD nuclease subunit